MSLTDNDRRVLESVEHATSQWGGYIPHGSRDWTAVRRLATAGLVECVGHGACETCDGDEPHEAPVYRLVARESGA